MKQPLLQKSLATTIQYHLTRACNASPSPLGASSKNDTRSNRCFIRVWQQQFNILLPCLHLRHEAKAIREATTASYEFGNNGSTTLDPSTQCLPVFIWGIKQKRYAKQPLLHTSLAKTIQRACNASPSPLGALSKSDTRSNRCFIRVWRQQFNIMPPSLHLGN